MKTPAMRACRLVVMPEWQGAGIGMRFLNAVCQMQLDGRNRWQRRCRTYFHTSHPGLAAGLRRDPRWRQVSASLCGGDKLRSLKSMFKSHQKNGTTCGAGFGGHFRAVQGFKYIGDCRC
jgi:tRNA(Met) C34 N-acetyltransferase TmcA